MTEVEKLVQAALSWAEAHADMPWFKGLPAVVYFQGDFDDAEETALHQQLADMLTEQHHAHRVIFDRYAYDEWRGAIQEDGYDTGCWQLDEPETRWEWATRRIGC